MSDDLYSDEPARAPHIDGINASKFEAQGKPTKEQAKAVWDSMQHPSVRKVESILRQRGFDVSYRSIARWKDTGWTDKQPDPEAKARKEKERGGRATTIERAIRDEVAKIPQAEVQAANNVVNGQSPGPTLTPMEDVIAKRRDELMMMSETQLDLEEAKARRVMNILMMESAGKRAHVMVLIPKETAPFIEAMTEARRTMSTGIIDKPPGSEREGDGNIIDVTPNNEHPLTGAINRFLKSEDMVG